MTCSWCEEEKELARLCNIESHRVCKECYGTYRALYPVRVEGCPYCKGTEEKVVIHIEIPEEIELSEVYMSHERPSTDLVPRQLSYHGECDAHHVGTTIALAFIVMILLLFISRSYGFT